MNYAAFVKYYYPGCENMIPPPAPYFFYLRENFFGETGLGVRGRSPRENFQDFQNEKLRF